ncbi:hypothetical protein RI065_01690 [Mycoplasmatota bacterium zrk1]
MNGFKRKTVIILMVILLLLTGCSGGSYKITMGEIDFTKDGVSGGYKEFNGYQFTSIKLEEGDTISFNLEVTTEEGNFTVKILDSEGDIILSINSDEHSKDLLIEHTGTYRIQVEGDKHEGEFDLVWYVN